MAYSEVCCQTRQALVPQASFPCRALLPACPRRAYVSAGSLITTFEFVLPKEFQKASCVFAIAKPCADVQMFSPAAGVYGSLCLTTCRWCCMLMRGCHLPLPAPFWDLSFWYRRKRAISLCRSSPPMLLSFCCPLPTLCPPHALPNSNPIYTGGHACRQDSQARWPGHQRNQPSWHQLSRGLWRSGQPGEAAGGAGWGAGWLFRADGHCLGQRAMQAGTDGPCAATRRCVHHLLHLTPLPSPPPLLHSATG